MHRRQFLQSGLSSATYFSLHSYNPSWITSLCAANSQVKEVSLAVSKTPLVIDGRKAAATTVNGTLPGPLLRFKEGSEAIIHVQNFLEADTSIHWHGVLLPFTMDGVPGVSFPGIKPGETFTYTFPLRQAGTYWYHSHSGLQEQEGVYGPIIIDPREPDPVAYDREYIVVLSDWTFESPHRLFHKLKAMSDNYNYQKRTVSDFFSDVSATDFASTLQNRLMWGDMRMDPTDLADVTASTYTYLLNGHTSADNWTGIYQSGERVRLRIINASAMTIFNFRIPGLPMTVVQADGLNVQPVETDEFQIGVAETYDVIVKPSSDKAYTIMAETIDRSRFIRGTIAPRLGMTAPIPSLRLRPLLTMKDMGMKHETGSSHSHHHHSHHSSVPSVSHDHVTGPGVVNVAKAPTKRLGEPGLGLEDVPHRVLVYTDLKSLDKNPDLRPFERELTLHLTGNMERYMWSFDGKKFSETPEPIVFYEGERIRLTMVNDTMMSHPIHLHGMFFELVTGEKTCRPRKHTVIVKPGEILSVDVTANEYGDWAFHCHLLYHMHAGMMRVVSVRRRTDERDL